MAVELPNADGGGGPAGVKDPAEDGGGPAGVVEGFAPYEKILLDLLSGVAGGLEEYGTWKAIVFSSTLMIRVFLSMYKFRVMWQPNICADNRLLRDLPWQ